MPNASSSPRIVLGRLPGVLEHVVKYAGEREALGKPLGQAIQHMIADTSIELESARFTPTERAGCSRRGDPARSSRAQRRSSASEACASGADRGLQILGGYGYSTEFDMQRYRRDTRDGPQLIGESLGLQRSF